jgi:hypothetical protein
MRFSQLAFLQVGVEREAQRGHDREQNEQQEPDPQA